MISLENMKHAKLFTKICLGVEFLVFLYFLLVKDANCHGDCFDGANTAIIYVLPLIVITIILYIGLKLYDGFHK
jgi:hypothetical protein